MGVRRFGYVIVVLGLITPVVAATSKAGASGVAAVSQAVPQQLPSDTGPIALRSSFGLPVDGATLAAAREEQTARYTDLRTTPDGTAGGYFGMDLTDKENLKAISWMDADRKTAQLEGDLEASDDALLGILLTTSFDNPRISVYYASQTIPLSLAESVKSLGLPVDFIEQPYGRTTYQETVRGLATQYDQFKAGERSPKNPFAALNALGFQAVEFGSHRSRVQFVVTLLDKASRPEVGAARTAVASQFSRAGFSIDASKLTIAFGERRADGATRDQDLGQMKAGLEIQIGPFGCTSNAVMRNSGGTLFLLTAGHCVSGVATGTAVTQNGNRIGAVSGYWHNGGGIDVGLVTLDGGYASEYFLAQTPTYVAHEFLVGPPNYPIAGNFYCFEGSSDLRVTYFGSKNTECGNYQYTTTDSYPVIGIRFCEGDSGGLVRNGTIAVGVGAKLIGTNVGGGVCTATVGMSTLQSAQNLWGLQLIARSPANSGMPVSWSRIQVQHSSKCLDGNWGAQDMWPVYQWGPCHGEAPQQWTLVPRNDLSTFADYYELHRFSYFSWCLDLNMSAYIGDHTPVIQYTCHGGANQVWGLFPATTTGWFALHVLYDNRCLDVYNASQVNQVQVSTWSCVSGVAQQTWRVV